MYRAYFEVKEKEPEKLYFSVDTKKKKVVEFTVKEKVPVKFVVDGNLKLTVDD